MFIRRVGVIEVENPMNGTQGAQKIVSFTASLTVRIVAEQRTYVNLAGLQVLKAKNQKIFIFSENLIFKYKNV